MAPLANIATGTWNVDSTHSEIGFVARHVMVAKTRGKFTDYTGVVEVADDPKNSTVTFTVQTASFDTGNADRDGHVKGADFFDVEQFPTMTFTSTKITDDEITGDLTIKGTTKSVTFDYDFNGTATDPWGGTRAGIEATGEINRSEFGITFNAPLDGGGVMISEKIKLNIDLEFVKA